MVFVQQNEKDLEEGILDAINKPAFMKKLATLFADKLRP